VVVGDMGSRHMSLLYSDPRSRPENGEAGGKRSALPHRLGNGRRARASADELLDASKQALPPT
jgi:hypothetical protein